MKRALFCIWMLVWVTMYLYGFRIMPHRLAALFDSSFLLKTSEIPVLMDTRPGAPGLGTLALIGGGFLTFVIYHALFATKLVETNNSEKTSKKPYPLFLSCLAAVIMALVLIGFGTSQFLGHVAGSGAGKRSIERLQLLWPTIVTMPESDRALLAGLAMTCHVEDLACLREAATDPNAILPKGTDRSKVPARLEELMHQRQT